MSAVASWLSAAATVAATASSGCACPGTGVILVVIVLLGCCCFLCGLIVGHSWEQLWRGGFIVKLARALLHLQLQAAGPEAEADRGQVEVIQRRPRYLPRV